MGEPLTHMKRHFALPIALAAALHLALLFGFRAPVRAPVTNSDSPTAPVPRPPLDVVDIVPEPMDTDGGDAGGPNTTPPPPSGEDLSRLKDPGDFPMVVEKPRPHMDETPKTIPARWGNPTGNGPGFTTGIGPVAATALDRVPRALVQAGAVYPFEARKEGLNGEVLVEFTVDRTGEVRSPHVVRSSDRLFEEAALRAVAKWRFEPGRQNGRVVAFRMAVPVVFRIDE